MKKLIISIILVIFTSFSFAETAPICSSTPSELTNYFSTILNVLNKVKQTNPENDWWLKWLLQKTLENGFWWPAILLFFWLEWFWNFFQNLFVIFHEEYVVRDWVKLINFKQYLTKKFLQIWENGWLYEDLPSNLKEDLQKKTNNPYFLLKFNWNTYADFLKFLRYNQLAIESLYFSTVITKTIDNCNNVVNPFNTKSKSTKTIPWFLINTNHVKQLCNELKDTYLSWGVKEFDCESNLDKEINKFKQIWERSENANKRFECNWERLKNALFWTEFEKPECKWYWSVKVVKWWHIWVKWKVSIEWAWNIIFKATTDNTWSIIDTSNFNPDFSFFKTAIGVITWAANNILNTFKDLSQEKKIIRQNIINDKEDFINQINSLSSQISNYKKKYSLKQWGIFPGVVWKNIWSKFPQLSYYIWKWICLLSNTYPWCKEWNEMLNWLQLNQEPWIYENLVETCKNESPNKWTCEYPNYFEENQNER